MNYDIISNQKHPYEHLEKIVCKHLQTPFLKPIAENSHIAFDELSKVISKTNKPLILDSCCGTAMSTVCLATQYPDCYIIGIDKSDHRLSRASKNLPENMSLVHANILDIWRLIKNAHWPIEKHFIFYPNPYPKAQHFQRRLHGHAIFPVLLSLSPCLEIRSNWKLYLEEFQIACKLAKCDITLKEFIPEDPITLFEKKYMQAGQGLYQATYCAKAS